MVCRFRVIAVCTLDRTVIHVVITRGLCWHVLPRDAMHKRGLCRHVVSVRLCHTRVTFVNSVKTSNRILKLFTLSARSIILVLFMPNWMAIRRRDPLTGASNTRGYEK